WDKINWLAEKKYIPVPGLVGRVIINGGFRVATAVATGAKWTCAEIAAITSIDVIATFGVQAAYNQFNLNVFGRDLDEINLWERAFVDANVTSGVSRSLRFVGGKLASKFGLFKEPENEV